MDRAVSTEALHRVLMTHLHFINTVFKTQGLKATIPGMFSVWACAVVLRTAFLSCEPFSDPEWADSRNSARHLVPELRLNIHQAHGYVVEWWMVLNSRCLILLHADRQGSYAYTYLPLQKSSRTSTARRTTARLKTCFSLFS